MDTLAVQLYTSLLPRRIRDFHPLERAHGAQTKNTGSGKAAGYIIAPSHGSFSVLPVAAPSGAVRYLRRSAPAAAV